MFYNNLLELGVLEETAKILKKKGVDISVFEEIEDAALGNGGLGRLARLLSRFGRGGRRALIRLRYTL